MMAASLVKQVLGADGVVLTKIHGGLPHVDLALVAEECEKLGVKTAIYIQPLISFGTLADTLLFNAEAVNLIITVGATMERSGFPWMPTVSSEDSRYENLLSGSIVQHAKS
jgi:glycine reductase